MAHFLLGRWCYQVSCVSVLDIMVLNAFWHRFPCQEERDPQPSLAQVPFLLNARIIGGSTQPRLTLFSVYPQRFKEKKKLLKPLIHTLIFLWQVSHLSWLEKKTATALLESPLSATVEDALQSFLKVWEGQVAGKNTRVTLFFPKDIIETLNGRGFPSRGQFCVCLFYGKIRITCTAYQKYRFLQTHWISHMVGD